MDQLVAGIGPKVRQLRQGKGMSLQQLSDRSGVSTAAIHKVERNGMVPTITTLMKLANALNRSVGYFVDEEEETKPATLTRAGQGGPVYTSKQGLELSSISGPYGRFLLAGASATIDAAADSGPEPMEHPGEELIHMLKGRLEVEVAGEGFVLRRGDSLHFRTDRPHRWRNPDKREAAAIWLAIRSR